MFTEKPLHGQARARTGLAHDERLVAQPLRADAAFARQRVGGRSHHDQGVVGKGFTKHVHVLGGLAHDVEVVLVLRQTLEQVFAVAHHHGHVDTGVCCAKAAQQFGHGVLHGGEDGNFQAAALYTLQRGQVIAEQVHAPCDVLASLGQDLACGRQKNLFAQLLKQGLPHGFSQLLDLQRQSWG